MFAFDVYGRLGHDGFETARRRCTRVIKENYLVVGPASPKRASCGVDDDTSRARVVEAPFGS